VVAYVRGDLAVEHEGDLVAVVVEVEEALGAGGHGFLEQHDALVGLAAEELQGGEAARRVHVEMRAAARGYHEAFRSVHAGVLSCGEFRDELLGRFSNRGWARRGGRGGAGGTAARPGTAWGCRCGSRSRPAPGAGKRRRRGRASSRF